MPASDLEQYISYFYERLFVFCGSLGAFLADSKGYVQEHYGQAGVAGMYVVVAGASLVVVSKLIKLAFITVKYIILPAILLSFFSAMAFKTPFVTTFPVTIILCSVVALFRS